jgi:hypothetical protein
LQSFVAPFELVDVGVGVSVAPGGAVGDGDAVCPGGVGDAVAPGGVGVGEVDGDGEGVGDGVDVGLSHPSPKGALGGILVVVHFPPPGGQ